MKTSFRNLLKNSFFSIIVLILFCLIIEIIFRFLHGSPLTFHGDRIAKKTEGKEAYVLLENIRDKKYAGKKVTTNSLGLRDYRPPHKVDNKTQILILGDSFTFGFGVLLEESYPFLLEKLLNADSNNSNNKYEVINAGVPGYDTVQELELLKRIISHYSPKWIIVGFHPSDLVKPHPGKRDNNGKDQSVDLVEIDDTRKYERKINWMLRLRETLRYNSSFFSWFFKFYKTTLIKYIPPPKGFLSLNPERFLDSPQFNTCKIAFKEIRKYSNNNNAEMIIFMVVPLVYWDAYPYMNLHKAIAQFCKDESIYFVDPFDEFSKYNAGELWVAPNDSHYNPKANEIAAKSIFSFFQSISTER